MTTNCSLNYKFSTWKLQAQNMLRTCCVHKLFFVLTFRTIYVHSIFWTCSAIAIFMYWTCNSINNLFSYCGLFIWCKIKCFWKRFSCKKIFDKMYFLIQTPSNMKLKCWYITPLKYVSVFQFHQCLVLRTFRQQDWFFFSPLPNFFLGIACCFRSVLLSISEWRFKGHQQ